MMGFFKIFDMATISSSSSPPMEATTTVQTGNKHF
jgi:hypothetical protein